MSWLPAYNQYSTLPGFLGGSCLLNLSQDSRTLMSIWLASFILCCCLGFGLCSGVIIIFGSDKLYLVFIVYLVCTTSGQWSGFKVYLLSFIILY